MTESELALLIVKGTISEMDKDDQDKIDGIIGQYNDIMDDSKDNDEEHFAQLALTVVGLETAVAMGQ